MRIEILPSAPGDQKELFFLTSFLVDGRLAVDAGALGTMPVARQREVTDVFLTHSHLDHVATLPLFLGNVFRPVGPCPRVYGAKATLDSLKRDLMNDRLWPDLLRLAAEGWPQLEWSVLDPERPVEVAGVRITPVFVDHVVPTLGYVLESAGTKEGGVAVIAGDTGPTDRIWELARARGNLRLVLLELSFPDRLEDLATVSKHLSPRSFAEEAKKIGPGPRIVAVHVKPPFHEEIAAELTALALPRVELGRPGHVYEL